jgi:acetyl esterase/lipase
MDSTPITSSTKHYTERTITLPDGIEIFYTDSGAPNSDDYATLIILHGSAYNGGEPTTHSPLN